MGHRSLLHGRVRFVSSSDFVLYEVELICRIEEEQKTVFN
jgi:hypothetical protein